VIFDCDGVLVDSERLAVRIDALVLAKMGWPLTEEEIVEALDRIAIPTCVASSGSHAKMRMTLGRTGLFDRFEGQIFSADEVAKGKAATSHEKLHTLVPEASGGLVLAGV
jgi:beta-phosphoglucomutase-like phosphatase (HAD superfamily)